MITLNNEDYERANKKFYAKKTIYVPGIGINVSKFQLNQFDRESYRKKLGLVDSDVMILSIGELNENKNHSIVIKALADIKNISIQYYIVGIGNQKDNLARLAKDSGVQSKVKFLDYRIDVNELLHSSDILFILH